MTKSSPGTVSLPSKETVRKLDPSIFPSRRIFNSIFFGFTVSGSQMSTELCSKDTELHVSKKFSGGPKNKIKAYFQQFVNAQEKACNQVWFSRF